MLDSRYICRDTHRMQNVILELDDTVLARVRRVAVDEHTSVSAWVRALIARELEARDLYEQNRRGALLVLKEDLSLGGRPLSREEVHER